MIMKRFIVLCLFFVPMISFADTAVTDFYSLPGRWEVLYQDDRGFGGSPTEEYGIKPFAQIRQLDGDYFGFVFSYEPGAFTGTGSPMMGDFEFYPQWEEFGWYHLAEADFRALLEMFGSDLRRQNFWKIMGSEEFWGYTMAIGMADFDNKRYGFAAVVREADVAWYFATILFCDAEDYNDNIEDMKQILDIDY